MYDQEIFKSKSSFFQIIQYTSLKKKNTIPVYPDIIFTIPNNLKS